MASFDHLHAMTYSQVVMHAAAMEVQRDRLREALERISVLDGANAPAGVPTSEYLRSIAREALSRPENERG